MVELRIHINLKMILLQQHAIPVQSQSLRQEEFD